MANNFRHFEKKIFKNLLTKSPLRNTSARQRSNFPEVEQPFFQSTHKGVLSFFNFTLYDICI